VLLPRVRWAVPTSVGAEHMSACTWAWAENRHVWCNKRNK